MEDLYEEIWREKAQRIQEDLELYLEQLQEERERIEKAFQAECLRKLY